MLDSPKDRLRTLLWAPLQLPILTTAAKFGIADRLANGPRDVASLAKSMGAHEHSLGRLLRALEKMNLLAEDSSTYRLTEMGELLRSDSTMGFHWILLLFGEKWHWECWGSLYHSIQTGESAFRHCHRDELFDYLQKDKQRAKIFDNAMTGFSQLANEEIVGAYPFSEYKTIVDIGGGLGSLLNAILECNPQINGALFDLAHVIQKIPQDSSIRKRKVTFLSGNFFESIPQVGDLFILKSIVHDWPDEKATIILKKCREAIPEHGRILLIERVLESEPDILENYLVDIYMLLNTSDGKERTRGEFETLLSVSGFKLVGIHSTRTPRSIVEAQPI